jgi:putative FmdB family regulatory protein
MASYDYICKDCKQEFQGIRKIDDRLKIDCPECQSSNIQIMIKQAQPFNYDNRMGAYKTSDNFNDRLKDMAKNCGSGHTINTR